MQETAQNAWARRRSAGLTLIELMIAMALVAVIVGLAVPNARAFIQDNRLASASNDLLHSLQLARAAAITTQQSVAVCASAAPAAVNPTCSYGSFYGWIVFEDRNSDWQVQPTEQILERHALLDSSITVRTDNDGIESYDQSGFSTPVGTKSPVRTILICDERGTARIGSSSSARAVRIENTGRPRVTRDVAEITRALAAVASPCP
jgi:type IV fimbrial biogenesis protein FimT